ncbi:hypothetical protein HanIR_Chr16g0831981 [Helianthus annuus]|nr:hypothetical protein HanIR_Chr16g0831981 [Helianthus annuus]
MKAGSRYESKNEEFLLNLHIFHNLEYNSAKIMSTKVSFSGNQQSNQSTIIGRNIY